MVENLALVGIGKIARDQHVPAICRSADWHLAATCSKEGNVEGVDSYAEFESLLSERPDIKTISFCVPPAPRYHYAAAAIRAGRNVMLEKPPGATLAECYALEAMAREEGVSIYATWHSREAAQVDPAKAWLANRQVNRLSIIWKEDVRRWHPGQTWIWQPGGLGIFDPVINAFSIATKILPKPLLIAAAELQFPENCETPIAGRMDFTYPGATEATADVDFLKQGDQIWTIEIETDDGRLVLHDGGARMAINGVEQPRETAELEDANALNPLLAGEYDRLYAKMAKLVHNGVNDMDLSPLVLVADAFMYSRRVIVEPFFE